MALFSTLAEQMSDSYLQTLIFITIAEQMSDNSEVISISTTKLALKQQIAKKPHGLHVVFFFIFDDFVTVYIALQMFTKNQLFQC